MMWTGGSINRVKRHSIACLIIASALAGLGTCHAPAAEYEVVGVLAFAVEPDTAKELGLTENQLKQLHDLINEAEAEILTELSELKGISPKERSVRLAQFRSTVEEQGLLLLSTQQRAKLEQLRLKRLGRNFFSDPVVADKLGLSEEQREALAEALTQPAGGDESEPPESAAAAVLTEAQKKALRAMLLGELVRSQSTAAQPVEAEELLAAQTGAQVQSSSPGEARTSSPQVPGTVLASAGNAQNAPGAGSPSPALTENEVKGGVTPPRPPSVVGLTNGGTSPGPQLAVALAEAKPANEPKASAQAPAAGSEVSGSPTPASPPVNEKPPVSSASPSEAPKSSEPGMSVGEPPAPEVKPEAAAGSPDTSAAPAVTSKSDNGEIKVTQPGEAVAAQGGAQAESARPTVTVGGQGAAPASPVTQAGTEKAGQEVPQLPPRDVKLRFNFRYQPWKGVLEWLAQQAGLSLVMEAPPPGTFNYVDDHEFTPAEAIDLLNSVLLTKGYVLVRRERMLILLNIEDGVPPNLVDRVTPEELNSRGDYEMVSCLFQLRKMTPEEAEQEVKKLLGPQGSLVVLGKARQLLVTETAGRLKTIRRMLEAIENPDADTGTVRIFKVNPYTVDQVLTIVRQMFQIPPDQTATADGSLRFALDPSGGKLLVTGTPDLLDRFAQVLKALDPSSESPASRLESTPQLEVYPITSADPQMVLQVLQTLLAGMPDVRLAIDPRTGALVAWARPAQHATIRATLQQMQGEVGQVEVIPLRVVDPQLAVLAINKLFGGSGESAAANAPTVDADIATRMLLIRGTRSQIEQIKQLLVKMGEPSGEGVAGAVNLMRTIPMDAATAQAVLEQVQSIWPQFRGNRLQIIRSVVPSEPGNSATPKANAPSGTTSDGTDRSSYDIESTRIPLPLAAVPARRLVLGLNSGTGSTSASGTNSSGGSSTASSQSPQPPAGTQQPGQPPFQPPFFRPWGGAPPGGFFDRGGDWNRDRGGEWNRDRGDFRDRGRDWSRSTFWEAPETEDEITEESSESEVAYSGSGKFSVRMQFVAYGEGGEGNETEATSSGEQPGPGADQQSPEPPPEPLGMEDSAAAQGEVGAAPSGQFTSPPEQVGPSQPAPSAEQKLGVPAAESFARQREAGAPPVIVAVTPEGLVIASQDPEALNQFEDLVRRMISTQAATARQTTPELVIFYLKHARAEVVASTLDQILGGGTLTTSGSSGGSLIGEIARAAFGELGGGLVGTLLGADTGFTSTSTSSSTRTSARVQITPDSRLNALIVQAYPQDLQLIEEILRVLDQADSPQDIAVQPKTVIIPVKNTQAEEIAQILRTVYQDRLVTGSSANRPPSPQEIIQLLRGGRGGPGGRTQPQQEQERMSIGVDTRTNSLIVSAPERLLNEVRQLVEQLDQKAITDSEETTQVVTLQRANAESVRTALSALLGNSVQMRSGSSGRTSTAPATPPSSSVPSSSSSRGFQGGFGSFRGFGTMPFGGGATPFGGRTFMGGTSSSGRTGTRGR